MGLTNSLQIGRSALIASQYGLSVTGNNLANAATDGYSRQTTKLQGIRQQNQGGFTVGRGVFVRQVQREVDEAILTRLRGSMADASRAREESRVLGQLESTLNELTDFDLSSQMDEFFNTWSDAANLVGSEATAVEQGERLSSFIRRLRGELGDLRGQIDDQIFDTVNVANGLFAEIAGLNEQIASVELAGRTASALRDQRDQTLQQLSEIIDITVEAAAGPGGTSQAINVFVGSTPVVIATQSRGVRVEFESQTDRASARVVRQSDGTEIDVTGGTVGGLIAARNGEIDATIDRLDDIAQSLIFEVNKVYAESRGESLLTAATSAVGFLTAERTLPLSDPRNSPIEDLPFPIENGGFYIDTVNPATGASERRLIEIDLDGIDAAGATGNADDTTPQTLLDAISAVSGVSADFNAAGQIVITADPGWEFAFDGDSSGLLAALGINRYFEGTSAATIGVRDELAEQPGLLTLGSLDGDQFNANGAAVAISDLATAASQLLGGVSIRESWQDRVQGVAVRAASAQTESEAQAIVVESLRAQRDAISGVSVDEESINLLQFQQQFQGGARLISTADELLNTLIALV